MGLTAREGLYVLLYVNTNADRCVTQSNAVDMRQVLVDLFFLTRPTCAEDALKFAFHVSSFLLSVELLSIQAVRFSGYHGT